MAVPDRWARIEALYHGARARKPEERASFLAAECGEDDALREDVESLLAQPVSDDKFLHAPAVAVAAQLVSSADRASLTGRRVGVYQVQALLDTGGMGEVYRARDTKLRRDVAMLVARFAGAVPIHRHRWFPLPLGTASG